jgi:hypothetical protein
MAELELKDGFEQYSFLFKSKIIQSYRYEQSFSL